MSKNNISFILHKPQLSENIGACARAIKNFNFKKLVLINPKPIFPNDKILAISVGAKDIIKQSKKYDNLENALEKIDILIATSARFRNKNIKHINLEDLKKINFKKRVGFLFGSEASGLSNNEISYANYTLQIPTNPDFKSLNLSHSLIIIAQYVSSIINLKVSSFKKSNKVRSASKKEIIQEREPNTGEHVPKWTGSYIFENEWQSFRTRQERSIELKSVTYELPSLLRKIAVKVVDI